MGNMIMRKDGTAQGIAKVRHYESLLPPERRLYHDPFAYAMYPGSFVQKWMGPALIDSIYRWMGMAGLCEMISIRTRWLDDQIVAAVGQDGEKEPGERAKKLIILGAGYDTRGFRLDLWKDSDDFVVIEVDQPDVQQRKMANLNWLAEKDENGRVISERMESKKVQFLPVDFNTDDLQQKLQSTEGFRSNQRSVVTLEGLTQYLPKESSADTLTKLKSILGRGSTVLITYVDEKCLAEPSELSPAFRTVRKMAAKVGEPWISGWTKEGFKIFIEDLGYEVVSDTAPEDYNATYLRSVERELDEGDLLSMERFVVAKVP